MSCAWDGPGMDGQSHEEIEDSNPNPNPRKRAKVDEAGAEAEEEEEDPLEAFMREISATATIDMDTSISKAAIAAAEAEKSKSFPVMERIKAASVPATIDHVFERVPNDGVIDEDVDAGDGQNEDENENENELDRPEHTLPPIDHSKIEYHPFECCFYDEAPEIAGLPQHVVNHERKALEMKVHGIEVPHLISTFEQCGFDETTMKALKKQGHVAPTGIQRQALPIILSGRDLIGVAKTGSGKTLAYVLPMITHILDQPYLDKGEGPISIILAPTRELADQIFKEAKKYCKPHKIRVAAIYGGLAKFNQYKDLKNGSEVIVATPGRLIDLARKKAFNFTRVTYVVLDEADRMFDLGFENQVRSIMQQVRSDRQTLFFSATFPYKIELLSMNTLNEAYLKITMGEAGAANKDIVQEVILIEHEQQRFAWLANSLANMQISGQVLIFVSRKDEAEELAVMLMHSNRQYGVAAIHGDMSAGERKDMIAGFKDGTTPILVATDIAARGLDIRAVKTVVNYTRPKNISAHIHRVGRTGRGGDKGVAYTLVNTAEDVTFAGQLVHHLHNCEQRVSDELLAVAMKNPRFRLGRGRGSRGGRGGRGRGRGERQDGKRYSHVPPPATTTTTSNANPIEAALLAAKTIAQAKGIAFSLGDKQQVQDVPSVPAPLPPPPPPQPPRQEAPAQRQCQHQRQEYAPPPPTIVAQPLPDPPLPPLPPPNTSQYTTTHLQPQHIQEGQMQAQMQAQANPLYAHFRSSDHSVGSSHTPAVVVYPKGMDGEKPMRILEQSRPPATVSAAVNASEGSASTSTIHEVGASSSEMAEYLAAFRKAR